MSSFSPLILFILQPEVSFPSLQGKHKTRKLANAEVRHTNMAHWVPYLGGSPNNGAAGTELG